MNKKCASISMYTNNICFCSFLVTTHVPTAFVLQYIQSLVALFLGLFKFPYYKGLISSYPPCSNYFYINCFNIFTYVNLKINQQEFYLCKHVLVIEYLLVTLKLLHVCPCFQKQRDAYKRIMKYNYKIFELLKR
jgi:hypothetical protein